MKVIRKLEIEGEEGKTFLRVYEDKNGDRSLGIAKGGGEIVLDRPFELVGLKTFINEVYEGADLLEFNAMVKEARSRGWGSD